MPPSLAGCSQGHIEHPTPSFRWKVKSGADGPPASSGPTAMLAGYRLVGTCPRWQGPGFDLSIYGWGQLPQPSVGPQVATPAKRK
jgi:hypothetical protein